jgi:hypothetical protein
VFVDQLGITGAYDTETGVLTLSGTAPLADYETALRSIAFRQTSDNPTSGKSVEFQVNDGELDSSTGTKSIAITGVNDNPAVDTTDTALAYTEGDGAVAVDPALTATDPDSSHLATATVSITAGFVAAEDELAFTENPENGITGVYDDTTGVLTLSGAAFVDEYETALRSVTYANASDAPTAARTISFQVDDGSPTDNLSDVASRDVAITPVNDAPVVTTTAGNTAYVIGDPAAPVDAALTVSDADGASIEGGEVAIASGFELGDSLVFVDQLGISGIYNTATGVLTLTGTASVADYQTALRSVGYEYVGVSTSGSRSVEFTVTDGGAESAPAAKAVDLSSPPPPL